jgi:phosphatidylglycerol:prolipoprotein diacylglycerol transferase
MSTRNFRILGRWINAYKVFLCVGIYVGTLVSAAFAQLAGLSPVRVGFGAAACALCGMPGARIYHLVLLAPHYARQRSLAALWDRDSGGWGVFGALLTFMPAAIVTARLIHVPLAAFFDVMSGGVLAGGLWIRLGCVFNGCCVGRETRSVLGVVQHDTRGIRKRRIPVQLMEMGWWLLGTVLFTVFWSRSFRPGTYALGVLGWYGCGRFFLEPLRERPALAFGTVRVNQVVAAVLAVAACLLLAIRAM